MMFRADSGDLLPQKRSNAASRITTRIVRGDGGWGLGTLTSVFYSSEMSSQRKERGEGRVSPISNVAAFNECCSTNVKKGDQ